MLNWLRKKLGLHIHEWGAVTDVVIPGGVWESVRDPGLTVQLMERRMKVRWCGCGAYKNIY